jgi:LPS O-antigen subunit length determinant protein (WzzB/FepE family)
MNDVNRESGARPEPSARSVLSGPPSGYFLVVPQTQEQDSESLGSVVARVAKSWRLVVASVLAGGCLALIASLFMPTTYRAKIVVAPMIESEAIGAGGLRNALNNELGGIASAVGIDLSGSDARKQQFYATLTSQGFARDFILAENLMPLLFPDKWDPVVKNWRPGVTVPTLGAGVRKLLDHHRVVNEERKTGMVTVTYEWWTAEMAAHLANRTIEMVNDRLRSQAIHDADLGIQYLDKELTKTNVVGVQQGIYALIQDQVGKSMVANVQREYAYRVIDPAVVPDVRASPLRRVIGSVGAIAGLILSITYVLLRRPAQSSGA